MLQRLARLCYRRRWAVLGAWVVLLVGLFGLNSAGGGKFLDDFDLAGSESQEAVDLLEEHGFASRAGINGQIVFQADDVNDPAVRGGMEDLFAEMGDVIAPGDIVSPYTAEGARRMNDSNSTAPMNHGSRSAV